MVDWAIVDANGTWIQSTTFVLGGGEGDYYLQLQLYCPQKSTDSYFVVTEGVVYQDGSLSTLAIVEKGVFTAVIYPNPADNNVTVRFEGATAQLVIANALGQYISTQTLSSGDEVCLRELQSGVYFFELATNAGRTVKAVVKK